MKKMRQNDTKSKILAAAAKLFALKGYDGVSIREICKAADVNICMVSYYWGGKNELYYGIIDDLIDKQTEFAKMYVDFDKPPETLTYVEQKELLFLLLDKFTDFFYYNLTGDLIKILLNEHHKNKLNVHSPAFDYLRNLIAAILHGSMNDKEIIFKTIFILSQINSPAVMPLFSLRLLGQDEFSPEDIKIIKDNVKMYVETLIREAEK